MIKQTIIFILLLCATTSVYAEEVPSIKLTLDAALKRAAEANHTIEIAQQRLMEFEGMKAEALSGGLPQLTGTGQFQSMWRKPIVNINNTPFSFGKNYTVDAGIGVNQLLWDGGRVFKAFKGAKSELRASLENIRDAEDLIKMQVKQTFYQILYTEKLLEVLNRESKQLTEYLKSITKRYNEGIDSDYTLMRQEVEVSNLEPQILDAERNQIFLMNSLKVLLAINPEEKIELDGSLNYNPKNTPSSAELVKKAKSNRPDLMAAKHHQNALSQKIGVERAGYWPSLNFSTSYNWEGQTDDWKIDANERTTSLSSVVSLSWPIFDGLKTHARVQQAKSQFYQQRSQTLELEDKVIRDVMDAHTYVILAEKALASQQKSYTLAQKASAIAGKRFEAGLMDQLELIEAIKSQATAERLYYQATAACLTAEAALEKAVGGNL